jgi:FKBP-type peptidyl-prolyl cis-trans isomerase (trigger factor)
MITKAVLKKLRAETTEQDVTKFLECVIYRYLNKILNKVVKEYNLSEQDAEILRDRMVNMNLIQVSLEQEEEEEAQEEEPL